MATKKQLEDLLVRAKKAYLELEEINERLRENLAEQRRCNREDDLRALYNRIDDESQERKQTLDSFNKLIKRIK